MPPGVRVRDDRLGQEARGVRSHRRDGPGAIPTRARLRASSGATAWRRPSRKWPLTWRFVLAAQGWTRANQGRVAGEECASGSEVLRTRTCPYDSSRPSEAARSRSTRAPPLLHQDCSNPSSGPRIDGRCILYRRLSDTPRPLSRTFEDGALSDTPGARSYSLVSAVERPAVLGDRQEFAEPRCPLRVRFRLAVDRDALRKPGVVGRLPDDARLARRRRASEFAGQRRPLSGGDGCRLAVLP